MVIIKFLQNLICKKGNQNHTLLSFGVVFICLSIYPSMYICIYGSKLIFPLYLAQTLENNLCLSIVLRYSGLQRKATITCKTATDNLQVENNGIYILPDATTDHTQAHLSCLFRKMKKKTASWLALLHTTTSYTAHMPKPIIHSDSISSP